MATSRQPRIINCKMETDFKRKLLIVIIFMCYNTEVFANINLYSVYGVTTENYSQVELFTKTSSSVVGCAAFCSIYNTSCVSLVYSKGTQQCRLYGTEVDVTFSGLPASSDVVYAAMHGAIVLPTPTTPTVTTTIGPPPPTAYPGTYKDCQDAYNLNYTASGVYVLSPIAVSTFYAYCDMNDGVGWTVFSNRVDGSVNFDRTYDEYAAGFGDITGEYWLGLDYLYELTYGRGILCVLRVDLTVGSDAYFCRYDIFEVRDASTLYTMNCAGYNNGSSTVEDTLSDHSGQFFTAKDMDNDPGEGNCAVTKGGGYWFNMCGSSNINGPYGANLWLDYVPTALRLKIVC